MITTKEVLDDMMRRPVPDGFVLIPETRWYYVNKEGIAYNHLMTNTLNCQSGKYLAIRYYRYGKYRQIYIHRAVARLFVPNPYGLPQVNHKDGDRYNNHYLNLEWVTCKENITHSYDTGLKVVKNRPKQWVQFMEVGEVKEFDYNIRHKMLTVINRLKKEGYKFNSIQNKKKQTFTVTRVG